MTPPSTVRLLLSIIVLLALAISGATLAVGSHYDESQYRPFGKADTRVDTYGGPTAEQRSPGAEGVSYWTESILHAIPEDQSVYMKRSVTYRPMVSNCGAGDIDVLGVDRNNTYEGERRVDEDVTDSIKSFSEDEDARERYERKYGPAGDLTTSDWQYLERFEVEWYDRDDIGTPVQLFHGDRFVSAQRECFSNPEVAGWYRSASIVTVELENGTTVSPEEPTFSHWFWICDCASRDEAVETLGPPPSEADDSTPTPTANPASNSTSGTTTGGSTRQTGSDSSRENSDDPAPAASTPGAGSTDTPAPGPAESASGPTPAAVGNWDEYVVRTPTSAQGTGFTSLLAVVALLALGVLVRRR